MKIDQIKLKPGESIELLPLKIQKKTGKHVKNWRILKESIDARKKNDIRIVYSVEFNYDPEDEIGRMDIPRVESSTRPVIVGFGPCGIFAALVLARAVLRPIVLERGMDDALERAFAFSGAGADAIMIHSRKKEPDEIFEFIEKFREKDKLTPIVLVPTSFNTVYEEEFKQRGANIIIYANQLTRTGFPAMQNAAEMILKNHRAKECDDICMPFKEIIRLIPEDV